MDQLNFEDNFNGLVRFRGQFQWISLTLRTISMEQLSFEENFNGLVKL